MSHTPGIPARAIGYGALFSLPLWAVIAFVIWCVVTGIISVLDLLGIVR